MNVIRNEGNNLPPVVESKLQDAYGQIRQQSRGKVTPMKKKKAPVKGILIVAAAVCCIAGASAAGSHFNAVDWFNRTFAGNELTEEQSAHLEEISNTEETGCTDNGTTVTPVSVIYDGGQLFIQLKIETTQDVDLSEYADKENYCYHLESTDIENTFPGYQGCWCGMESFDDNEIFNSWTADPGTPSVAYAAVAFELMDCDADSIPTVYHFDSIQIEDSVTKEYTTVLTGSWDISLGEVDSAQHLIFAADGMTTEYYLAPIDNSDSTYESWPGGNVTLTLNGDIKLTPLGIYMDDVSGGDLEEYGTTIYRPAIQVIAKDGSVMNAPYDLSQVDHLQLDEDLTLTPETK